MCYLSSDRCGILIRESSCSLAWAEMYLIVATLVQKFDFDMSEVPSNHFDFISDGFIIRTPGKASLETVVTVHSGGES